ncbi:MAG TPA: GIY-YIG nuclease family protein [Vicinamibacterales bacterium]|nr:GIY-YIG nuclease family protein [Vicinamibacterales bacterium]
MDQGRRFVYVIKNMEAQPRYYTGLTSNFSARLANHNQQNGHHTSKYRPWKLDALFEFADEDRAIRFERYLKSGSGAAFAKKHLR